MTVGPEVFRDAMIGLAPDVVFANEDEERVGGRSPVDRAWILKRGSRGCSFDDDERAALPRTLGSSTPPEQATRSPRAGSSVGPISRSRRLRLRRAARRHAGSLAGVTQLIRLSDEIAPPWRKVGPSSPWRRPSWRTASRRPTASRSRLEMEAAVRAAGAMPATVGVLDGLIRIGLDPDELERFTPERAKARPARSRRVRGHRRRRRDHRGGSLAAARMVGIRVHGHGRPRWRPSRISRPSRRLRRPRRDRHGARARRVLGGEVPARHARDDGAPGDPRHPLLGCRTDPLPLFYAVHGGPPVTAARGRPGSGGARSRQPTGSSARAGSCSRTRRPRPSRSANSSRRLSPRRHERACPDRQ